MSQRWLDVETAKKVLKNTCDFLEIDKSGVADFKIPSREAFLMWIYTGATFYSDEGYHIEFNRDFLRGREPFIITKNDSNSFNPLLFESMPAISNSMLTYFRLFFNEQKMKYLILLDNSKYRNPWEEITERIRKNDLNPFDCLVWISGLGKPRNEEWYGAYGEDFWEYLTGIVLRKEGYFISRFSLGGGDIYAWKIPYYLEKLIDKKFLDKGAFIEELEMLQKLTTSKPAIKLENITEEIVCVEAESTDFNTYKYGKSNESSGIFQLRRYLRESRKFYTSGIVAGPFTNPNEIGERYGLISCDERGKLIYRSPSDSREVDERSSNIIRKYLRYVLLRNLTYKEICNLIGIEPTSLNEYLEKILDLDIDIILEKIDNKIITMQR